MGGTRRRRGRGGLVRCGAVVVVVVVEGEGDEEDEMGVW